MHEVTPFQFQDNSVRTILNENQELWFVAKDVCNILELKNITEALRGLDEDELTSEFLKSGGQSRKMKAISESGIYTLIMRSNKKQAKPFRRWVTHEVLPTIRKTGRYSTQSAPSLHLLESEIKEGASLLSQVIGKVALPERQKWQLVDKLFIELFGQGVEILTRPSTFFLQVYGPGPRMHYVGKSVPLLMLEQATELKTYRVELSGECLSWFVTKCCDEKQKAAASQQSLYKLFAIWFEEAFNHSAPAFEVFHDAMIKRYSSLSLAGEPWFVGVAPAVEVLT